MGNTHLGPGALRSMMKRLCVVLAVLAGCGGPRGGSQNLQSPPASGSGSERPALVPEVQPEVEAQAEVEPPEVDEVQAQPAPPRASPLPPVPTLAPYVVEDGAVLTVDRWDERTFVVLEEIDAIERAHPDDEDWDFDERRVEPSSRVVPSTFRLAGPAGLCEGAHGRAVVITTHSVPY